MTDHTEAENAGHNLWFGENLMIIRVPASAASDGISIVECRMPRGGSTPLHVELSGDDIIHVLEGAMRFRVDGEHFSAHSGQTVVSPKGLPHVFRIEPGEGSICLIVTQGEEFERMIREMSLPAPAGEQPGAARATEAGESFFDGSAPTPIQVVGAPLL